MLVEYLLNGSKSIARIELTSSDGYQLLGVDYRNYYIVIGDQVYSIYNMFFDPVKLILSLYLREK